MDLNPYKDPDSPSLILPNFFEILFDVANDGILTFPESGSRISCAYLKMEDGYAFIMICYGVIQSRINPWAGA